MSLNGQWQDRCSLHVAQGATHPEALHGITDARKLLCFFRINF